MTIYLGYGRKNNTKLFEGMIIIIILYIIVVYNNTIHNTIIIVVSMTDISAK